MKPSTARPFLYLLFLFITGCLLEQGLAVENELAKVTASDAAPASQFGVSVRIDGDTVVVGAEAEDDVCDRPNQSCNSGAAYIFERNQGGPDVWGQVKKLTASDAAQEDFFGYGVAIQGDTVVVGAPEPGFTTPAETGVAYVFERNTGGANN